MSNENPMTDRSVGNPGQTADSEKELDQPEDVGNPGTTVHPEDELNRPKDVGNPGPEE